jgi:hypothetical protein
MKNATKRTGLALALLTLVLGAGRARAGLVIYTDRAAFDAATTGTSTIDFEGIAGGGAMYEPSPFVIGGVSFTDAGVNRLFVFDKGFYGPGLSSDYLNQNGFGTQSTLVTPGGGTTALGTDLGTLNQTFGGPQDVTVDVTDGSGLSTFVITTPAQPGLGFVGFTSDTAILSVNFTGTFVVLDNVTTGQALRSVPEPSALISAGIGGLMALGYGWRRQKANPAA